mgnify:FL=1|jgi:hypothetical protein
MVKFKYKTKIHNFFHLPKTGGTSISFFIQDKFEYDLVWKLYEKEFPLGSQHLDYNHYSNHVSSNDLNFTVVRNPVDRIVSLYKNFIAKDTNNYNSFTDWFNITARTTPHILKSQSSILKGGTFKFFNFDNMSLLENYFDAELPKYNVIDLVVQMDDNEVDFIKKYYLEDFQLLEYINSQKHIDETTV